MPSIAHVLYIPGILLVGIAIGFVMGARAGRAEAQKQSERRRR